ncbi:MAG: type VI secretion system tip protein TssI/VgrG, partial [Pseudomonadota bacterium]
MTDQSDFIQAERILRIESPLGADVLLAQKLTWREAVSELFEAHVAVRSKNQDLKAEDLLGKPVDLSLELGGGARRVWNAIVTDLTAGPRQTRGLRSYSMVLRPDVWLLSQTSDCRIWLDKSAIDIAQDLLSEHGIAAPVLSGVVDPVPPQHYSVQWNETDLDYLTRRLEEDGLFYWWSHSEGQHRMHISSHAAGYTGGEDVRFAHGSTDRNHITRFETTFRYVPGSHAGRDWNFVTPGTVPGGDTPSLVSLPKNGDYERYEYPVQAGYGRGTRASDGIEDAEVTRVSKLRMQALEADHARIDGASTVRTLAAGARFTPYDVANPDNIFEPHVILAIEHEAADTSYESGTAEPQYENRFLALPADVPATPHCATPRPRIDGAQVAIVAGPLGEEIHPDEYGRIKVWFPWDRRAKKDGTDTCWIRVMQNWAGTQWGGQVIPRIGMEVMVTYLDGDPDRPVVTGVVPNETQRVPYPLPSHKTRSVFRTNSHKSPYVGFNELRFEDMHHKEEIFIRAQKNLSEKVQNDQASIVDGSRVSLTGMDSMHTVAGSLKQSVRGSVVLEIGNNGQMTQLAKAGGEAQDDIQRLVRWSQSSFPEAGGGGFSISVENARNEKVGGADSLSVTGAKNVAVKGRFSTSAEQGYDVQTASALSLRGKTMNIAAENTLTLACGKSRLTLHSNGT